MEKTTIHITLHFLPIFLVQACGEASIVQNGFRSGDDFTFGATVHYKCNPGFLLTGSMNRTCLNSGKWSGNFPTCNGSYF